MSRHATSDVGDAGDFRTSLSFLTQVYPLICLYWSKPEHILPIPRALLESYEQKRALNPTALCHCPWITAAAPARAEQSWARLCPVRDWSLGRGLSQSPAHMVFWCLSQQLKFRSLFYSILFTKQTLMLHGTPFLVLFFFWLDVSVFQHMHPWMWDGKVIGEVEIEAQQGLQLYPSRGAQYV